MILILEKLPIEDMFNLMRISENCYNLLNDDFYWSDRLPILFSTARITHHQKTPNVRILLSKSPNPSRLMIAAMINRSYSDAFFYDEFRMQFRDSLKYKMWHKDLVDPSAYAVLRNTICRYVRWASFRPLEDFESIIRSVLSDAVEGYIGGYMVGYVDYKSEYRIPWFRDRTLCHFKNLKSRFALLRGFIGSVVDFFENHPTESINADYIRYCWDCFKVCIDNPNNHMLNFMEPYIERPINLYVCEDSGCGHRLCVSRELKSVPYKSVILDVD
jgi:hypothetical protein